MLLGWTEAQLRTAKEVKEVQTLRGERTMPLIRAQLDFASVVVDASARGTKFWCELWGPFGEPAIDAVNTIAEAQQRSLRTLRETLEKKGESRT